jgi:hypothetical protein
MVDEGTGSAVLSALFLLILDVGVKKYRGKTYVIRY